MENNNIITYGSINKYNTISCILFLLIFIFIIFNNYADIVKKINRGTNRQYFDYRGIIFGDGNFLEEWYDRLAATVFHNKVSPLNDNINSAIAKTQKLSKRAGTIDTDLTKNSVSTTLNLLYNQEKNKNLYNEFKRTIDTIKQKNKENNNQIAEIKKEYSDKIKTYVKALVKSLDVVKYHINISMVTPSLKQLVAPLVKYYKALEQGLTSDDNVSFIKTYYKDYDETKVKPLETKVEKIQELTGQTEVLDKKIQEYKSALT